MRAYHFGFLILAVTSVAYGGPPKLVGFNPLKQLVFDTRVIEHVDNAQLVLGTPEKDPRNPLMPADKPWENSTNNLYPNLLWDEHERIFKIWYKNVLVDKEAIALMDQPSTVHNVGWYLLYATSRDGIAWDKPALGLHAFGGSTATNIVARDTPNVGVFKDPRDPNAAHRYKMVYDVGLGKLRVRFSPDGVHWSEPMEVNGFSAQHGDTHNNAFWDERIKKYVWITKLYIGERTVARFESDDFINWKSSGMVLRSTVEEGRVSQTYCMPTFQYGNVYLGYLMMYNLGKGRTVDCELAWSPDGVRWQRLAPGKAFIPRGPTGSYDSQCIYAQAGPAMEQDGKLLIYYGGSDTVHVGWKRHCLLSLARLRVDGFAGFEAVRNEVPAVVTSRPVRIASDSITLSADAANGSVLVELVGDGDRVLATSKLVRGDVIDERVELDLTSHVGKTGRLRFTLNGARLYAFGGVKLVTEEMSQSIVAPLLRHPPTAHPIHVTFDQDVAGWKGIETIDHVRNSDGSGHIKVSRSNKLNPIASSPADAASSPFAGDWTKLVGGETATVTFRLRGSASGYANLELFAKDTQWSYRLPAAVLPKWQTFRVLLKYDWTDADAIAAGWSPARTAFSWRDTITHIGRVHVTVESDRAPTAEHSFELDDVTVTGN